MLIFLIFTTAVIDADINFQCLQMRMQLLKTMQLSADADADIRSGCRYRFGYLFSAFLDADADVKNNVDIC